MEVKDTPAGGTIDLNDVPSGIVVWFCEPNSDATLLNYPAEQWGTLISFKNYEGSGYIMGAQIYIPVLDTKMYYREYYQNGGWSIWSQVQVVTT